MRSFIIPNIVLYINGLPLVVIECKKGGPTCSTSLYEAFIQLAEWEDLNKSAVRREWVNGETFLYLGSRYRLKIVQGQRYRVQVG